MKTYRFVFTKKDIGNEEMEMSVEAQTDKEAIAQFFNMVGGFNHFGCHVSDGRIFTSHYNTWNKDEVKNEKRNN